MKNNIQKAVEILKSKGIVIFPTDTVYGIGTVPSRNSIKKIYEIKKRDYSKKIIALVSSEEKAFELIDKSLLEEKTKKEILKIMNKFWPGELTIIFQANKDFTNQFDEDLETIGIRIPKNEIALKIIKKSGGVVLTTSANISGEKDVIAMQDIDKRLLESVDYVVENNENLTGIPSTIVKYEKDKLTLLRKGNVSLEEIQNEKNGGNNGKNDKS